MSRDDKVCMELVFSKETSVSRRAKARAFWKFLDSQENMYPYKPPQDTETLSDRNSVQQSSLEQEEEPQVKSKFSEKRRIWYNELQIFHQLGLDRAALAAGNKCKQCIAEARLKDCEPELADTVPQPYDEINADIKAFGKRTEHQESTPVYNMSEKYQHLVS